MLNRTTLAARGHRTQEDTMRKQHLMKTLVGIGVALGFAGLCASGLASAGEAVPDRGKLAIGEYSQCPEPPTRTALRMGADGQVRQIVQQGLDARTAPKIMQAKRLTDPEVQELTEVLRAANLDQLAAGPQAAPPTGAAAKDTCTHRVDIRMDGKTFRFRYASPATAPAAVRTLVEKIHAILDRHEWQSAPEK
jgi:hypothetical protein